MASAHIRDWAKSGRTTITPARLRKLRRSSGHVRVLGEGQWVDLDEKKRPLETPKLPDWARTKRQENRGGDSPNGKHHANGQRQIGTNAAVRNGRGGLYRDELLGQVRALCGTVGFSLAKGVLLAV